MTPARSEPSEALRLAARFPIPPFPLTGEMRYIVWCFQRCGECDADIGGFSAIVTSKHEASPAYHVRCLAVRPQRERRRRIAESKRTARRVTRERRVAMERYVAALSADDLERLRRLIELARERGGT